MENKNFDCIKLNMGFLDSDKIDYLMSQKGGANYVMLYQWLCLKCLKTHGIMACKTGKTTIKYDAYYISSECKWFSIDTIIVALFTYEKLGLIYEDENGFYHIAKIDELTESQAYWAKKKREEREKRKNASEGK